MEAGTISQLVIFTFNLVDLVGQLFKLKIIRKLLVLYMYVRENVTFAILHQYHE